MPRFWLIGDVSRSLSVALLIAFPTAWLLGRWLPLPLTLVFLVTQAAHRPPPRPVGGL
jgi:hypothetical protein